MNGQGTGVRVDLACGATDMQKGIAGLAALAQDVLRTRHHVRQPQEIGGTPPCDMTEAPNPYSAP